MLDSVEECPPSQLVSLEAILIALASSTLHDEHYFSTAYRVGAGAAHPVSTTASV
jgi:hypothetical protein